MKLISDTPDLKPVAPPLLVHPVTTPAPPDPAYAVSYVAEHPQVIFSQPLTWKLSKIHRPQVRMSAGVKAWCDYSRLFSNWLYTSITVFTSTDLDELTIHIPDQFIDDLDRTTLVLSRQYSKGGTWLVMVAE